MCFLYSPLRLGIYISKKIIEIIGKIINFIERIEK